MRKVIDWIKDKFKKPAVHPAMVDKVKGFELDLIQADKVRELFCDDDLDPAVVASRFYKRYPRRMFVNLWDFDPINEVKYLTDPDLFVEGCELAESAMRVLGHITREADGKEYLRTDSPFVEVMQRAFMN